MFWSVQWEDRAGLTHPWSETSSFVTAPRDEDWAAGSAWVGADVGMLRREFPVAAASIPGAKVFIVGLGFFQLFVNGQRIGNETLSGAIYLSACHEYAKHYVNQCLACRVVDQVQHARALLHV